MRTPPPELVAATRRPRRTWHRCARRRRASNDYSSPIAAAAAGRGRSRSGHAAAGAEPGREAIAPRRRRQRVARAGDEHADDDGLATLPAAALTDAAEADPAAAMVPTAKSTATTVEMVEGADEPWRTTAPRPAQPRRRSRSGTRRRPRFREVTCGRPGPS